MPLPDENLETPGGSLEGEDGHKYMYYTREEWGAQKARWMKNIDIASFVLCTYSSSRPCFDLASCSEELKFVQTKNMQFSDNPDIRFNFLIGGDGAIYQGRGWGVLPRVPKRFAGIVSKSLYIAFLGKFKFTPPSARMFKAKDDLILDGVRKGHLNKKILIFTM